MQTNGGNEEKVLVFLSLHITKMNDEEKLAELKEKAMKCKVISLDLLGLHPLQIQVFCAPGIRTKWLNKWKSGFKKKQET